MRSVSTVVSKVVSVVVIDSSVLGTLTDSTVVFWVTLVTALSAPIPAKKLAATLELT